MTEALEIEGVAPSENEKTFNFNVRFLRDEAREALRTYFLPFSGVYAAVTGREVVLLRRAKADNSSRARERSRGASSASD